VPRPGLNPGRFGCSRLIRCRRAATLPVPAVRAQRPGHMRSSPELAAAAEGYPITVPEITAIRRLSRGQATRFPSACPPTVDGRTRLVRRWHHHQPWPCGGPVRRRLRGRSSAGSRICGSPTSRTSRWQKPETPGAGPADREARALHDTRGDGLKSSRFQAGFSGRADRARIVSRQPRWQQQVTAALRATRPR